MFIQRFMNINNTNRNHYGWFNRVKKMFSTRRNTRASENTLIQPQIYNYSECCNARNYIRKCLNCNLSDVLIIKGDVNPNRICVVCFDNNNVRYGCYNCVRDGLQSCCESCYSEIVKLSYISKTVNYNNIVYNGPFHIII